MGYKNKNEELRIEKRLDEYNASLKEILNNGGGSSTPNSITINGKTGTNITLTKNDIGLSDVINAEQLKKDDVGVIVPAIQANGKIKVEQTPVIAANLVSVANKAERLALPSNSNLTICLQADTSWMWSLNGGNNPSVESNWIDCGSTAATVVSVNGATGMVIINCENIGAVPVNRKINNKALSEDITLTINDIITLSNNSTQFLAGDGTWKTPAGTIAGTSGQIQFNDDGTSGADSDLTWDSTNKRLGIGIDTPSTELDVRSNKTTTPTELDIRNKFVGQNGSTNDYEVSKINIGCDGFNTSISTKIPVDMWGDGCRMDLTTPTGSNDNTQIPRLSIMPFTGNIGIGITNPSAKLDVKGLTNDGSTNVISAKDSDDVDVFSVDTNGKIITPGDHTSSGYFDIGNMRIQWGSVGNGVDGIQTVTLPAPFANTSYVVTGNVTDATTEWYFTLTTKPVTTTTFQATKMYGKVDISNKAGQGFSWMAIGMKP